MKKYDGPKNNREFIRLASRPEGIIIGTMMYISQSLLEDATFDWHPYMQQKALQDAKRWNVFDQPGCTYTFLTPEDYAYEEGPYTVFDDKHRPRLEIKAVFGRVRVTYMQEH